MRQGRARFSDPRRTQHGRLAVDIEINGTPTIEAIYRQDPESDGDNRWFVQDGADLGDAAGGTWDTLEEAMTAVADAVTPAGAR